LEEAKMAEQLSISLTSTPDPADEERIRTGLRAYNDSQKGDDDHQKLVVILRDEHEQLVGGLIGTTFWGWLSVDIFWLREDVRGQDFGSRMLRMAEDEARHRGCKQAMLDTLSFQAPEFYKKHGYEVFGSLDGFAGKHQRYYLKKNL
jgi:GNAT superfamily N-acetyltransferase